MKKNLPTHRVANKDYGFTLIELLVVIAIIAILAAMLLPALARAKNRAQAVTDLNNNKQIVLATQMYCNDASDFMPMSGWSLGAAGWCNGYPFALSTTPSQAAYKAFYPKQVAAFNGTTPNTQPAQLYSYLKTEKILLCPADVLNSLYYQRQQYLTSYIWNGAVNGYGTSPTANMNGNSVNISYRVSAFRPDSILMWENDETVTSYGQWNDFANFPDQGISTRHGKGATIGLFDGSSTRMRLIDFYMLAANQPTAWAAHDGSGKSNFPGHVGLANRLWCNPGKPYGTDLY